MLITEKNMFTMLLKKAKEKLYYVIEIGGEQIIVPYAHLSYALLEDLVTFITLSYPIYFSPTLPNLRIPHCIALIIKGLPEYPFLNDFLQLLL